MCKQIHAMRWFALEAIEEKESINMLFGQQRSGGPRMDSGRRRRKIQIARRVTCFFLALIIVVVGVQGIRTAKRRIMGEDSQSSGQKDDSVPANTGEKEKNKAFGLTAAQQEEYMRREILANPSHYPDELLELLEKYEETVRFVYEYSEKKDNPPADTIGEVVKGEIPLLIQWDERWGYAPYGDDMIGMSGCGPTVLSMVAAGLTGDNTITPYVVATYAQQNGFYVENVGTSWSLMTTGAEHFGIKSKEVKLKKSNIEDELAQGHPLVCSVREGDFTTGGHFIVLTGIEDGMIRINDPNSRIKSQRLWDFERLADQINILWAFWI